MRVDRVAADARLAPGGLQEGGQDAHCRGLARAVRPDIAQQIALGQVEREVIDGVQIAVGLGESLSLIIGLVSCQWSVVSGQLQRTTDHGPRTVNHSSPSSRGRQTDKW